MNREKKKNGDDKTSINQLLTAIFIYSSIFFAAGLTYDIVLYTLDAKWFLLAANTAALLMMGAVFAVYAAGKTDSDIALFANMLIVTLNLAVSIVYEGIVNRPDASFTVLLGMCICALPIIMASLTGIRAAPVIITLIIICSYSVSAILIGDEKLFLCMPILMLIYTGAPIALKSIVILSRRLEREKIEITREKSEFLRIMNIEADRRPRHQRGRQTDGRTRRQGARYARVAGQTCHPLGRDGQGSDKETASGAYRCGSGSRTADSKG